ncbi:uncharacterized protein LOC143302076 [Babylonia areolata]|uniref:uncharacterized protein LOC143302076 n=1 Tax=Babylonia areolata TaxID=304850 RepID=UPI003FD5EAD7
MDLNEEKRAAMKQALEQDGYCVVPNVLSESDCDEFMEQYKTWHSGFSETEAMKSRVSIVVNYAIGHSEMAWATRLATKPVFAALWDTEKLLTSVDGVAIAPPPKGHRDYDRGSFWLHCDQSALRQGLHGYQGAVYLEAASVDGYCLRVLTKSHNCHQLFFNTFPKARKKSVEREFCRLSKPQVKWYEDQGCTLKCVPVPKGGMVLWDSRVIHDNRPPTPHTLNPDRWRFVTFVCMTPAAWASKRDLEKKQAAYSQLLVTNHWASQKMKVLPEKTPATQRHLSIQKLPSVAKTLEARRLAGMEPYDFGDGEPNGRATPTWLKS